jgi:hypothetical protein
MNAESIPFATGTMAKKYLRHWCVLLFSDNWKNGYFYVFTEINSFYNLFCQVLWIMIFWFVMPIL